MSSEVANNNRIRLWCRYKIIICLNYQQGPRAVVSNFRSDCAGLNVTLELFPWTRNFAPIIWLLYSSTGIFSSLLLGLIAHLCHCRASYYGKKNILDTISNVYSRYKSLIFRTFVISKDSFDFLALVNYFHQTTVLSYGESSQLYVTY